MLTFILVKCKQDDKELHFKVEYIVQSNPNGKSTIFKIIRSSVVRQFTYKIMIHRTVDFPHYYARKLTRVFS